MKKRVLLFCFSCSALLSVFMLGACGKESNENDPNPSVAVSANSTVTKAVDDTKAPEVTNEAKASPDPVTEAAGTPEPTKSAEKIVVAEATPEPDDIKPTEYAELTVQSMTAKLRIAPAAGDMLTAKDFYVGVRMSDGSMLVNPAGFTADPLIVTEGTNRITIKYMGESTVIEYNAPAATSNVGPDNPAVIQEPTMTPVPTSELPASSYVSAFLNEGPSVLAQTDDMGQDYLNKIVFLGDSRTYSYKAYAVLSGGKSTTQVWTPSNGTMSLSQQGFVKILYPETGTEMTIRDAVALKKPEILCIGLGLNGISFMNEQVFKDEYRSLINDIKSLSPGTKIIINSIFPIANYCDLNGIDNTKINTANDWLVDICDETGSKYLNSGVVLLDANGYCDIRYDNGGGGYHLNKEGNELIMQFIRTHAYL